MRRLCYKSVARTSSQLVGQVLDSPGDFAESDKSTCKSDAMGGGRCWCDIGGCVSEYRLTQVNVATDQCAGSMKLVRRVNVV